MNRLYWYTKFGMLGWKACEKKRKEKQMDKLGDKKTGEKCELYVMEMEALLQLSLRTSQSEKQHAGLSIPMGGGKTRLTYVLSLELTGDKPSLIVCNKTLIKKTIDEIKKIFGDPVTFYVFHGDYNKDYASVTIPPAQFVITTPEVTKKYYKSLNLADRFITRRIENHGRFNQHEVLDYARTPIYNFWIAMNMLTENATAEASKVTWCGDSATADRSTMLVSSTDQVALTAVFLGTETSPDSFTTWSPVITLWISVSSRPTCDAVTGTTVRVTLDAEERARVASSAVTVIWTT